MFFLFGGLSFQNRLRSRRRCDVIIWRNINAGPRRPVKWRRNVKRSGGKSGNVNARKSVNGIVSVIAADGIVRAIVIAVKATSVHRAAKIVAVAAAAAEAVVEAAAAQTDADIDRLWGGIKNLSERDKQNK